MKALTPHIFRVQAARHCGIGGALNNGPAVGEEGHLIRIAPKFQNEIVIAD